jgi:hypothetical protein
MSIQHVPTQPEGALLKFTDELLHCLNLRALGFGGGGRDSSPVFHKGRGRSGNESGDNRTDSGERKWGQEHGQVEEVGKGRKDRQWELVVGMVVTKAMGTSCGKGRKDRQWELVVRTGKGNWLWERQ